MNTKTATFPEANITVKRVAQFSSLFGCGNGWVYEEMDYGIWAAVRVKAEHDGISEIIAIPHGDVFIAWGGQPMVRAPEEVTDLLLEQIKFESRAVVEVCANAEQLAHERKDLSEAMEEWNDEQKARYRATFWSR